jgi:polysaccharide pyruvyl transferase WcaK-like protein
MPTILIGGYYGFGNTGDEAILSAMLNDLRSLQPELEFIVVSGNPGETAAHYNVEAIPWSDIPALLEAVQQCNLIILGGGGLFHDYWGVQTDTLLTRNLTGIPFFSGFPLLAELTKKPCMIYAVGVGPLLYEEGKDSRALLSKKPKSLPCGTLSLRICSNHSVQNVSMSKLQPILLSAFS